MRPEGLTPMVSRLPCWVRDWTAGLCSRRNCLPSSRLMGDPARTAEMVTTRL